jgi:hypothetical protein
VQAMKAQVGVETQLCTLQTRTHVVQWSDSRSFRINRGKKAAGSHFIGSCIGVGAGQ